MAQVKISSIQKTYGSVEVLHNINIDIDDGEFVVLVGPSGCGKSTLLRMIAGLEAVTGGEIHISGKLVNNLPPAERDIAMVFQNYALYPHKTVAVNMGFALKMRNMSKQQIDKRVREAADILGLVPYLGRYPRELSGGQKQRVAMGRAIVRDPHVFLFDEPLSNLDAKLRVQMRAEIRQLHQRLGTTTIYVTHDQIEAMTMADKIVVMNNGHVSQTGKPLDLYDKPMNLFVAGFIGSPSMNFISGEILQKDGANQLVCAPLTLTSPLLKTLKSGQKITCGIRPEHIIIDKNGLDKKGSNTSSKAVISVVEQTGAETHSVMKIGDWECVAVSRERLDLQINEAVGVGFPDSYLHLFDTQTGIRI